MREQLLSYHGYALCQFKFGHPNQAIEMLDIVIFEKLGILSMKAAEEEFVVREKREFKY